MFCLQVLFQKLYIVSNEYQAFSVVGNHVSK